MLNLKTLELLTQHVESLIFSTEHPINKEEILACLEETFETPFKEEDLDNALEESRQRYQQKEFAFTKVMIQVTY